MPKLENIHDNFFKKVFSNKRNIRDFLKLALPVEFKKEINLSKIEIDLTGYVSEEIKGFFSDIVVKTKLKSAENDSQDTDIYILFEHKSYEDKKIFIQLLKYMYLMWQKDIDDSKPLRFIMPLVFYHGRKKWKVPQNFKDQFNVSKELKDFLLNFKYILFDTDKWNLEDKSNAGLKDNIHLLTSLMLMKSVFEKNLDSIKKIIDFWNENGFINNEKIIFFMLYIVSTRDIEPEELVEIIEEKELPGGDIMPTLAQRWLNQGIEKGMEQGIEKGIEKGKIIESRELLAKFLKSRFGSSVTKSDIKFINGVNDLKKLKNALELILSAESKDVVLDKLR